MDSRSMGEIPSFPRHPSYILLYHIWSSRLYCTVAFVLSPPPRYMAYRSAALRLRRLSLCARMQMLVVEISVTFIIHDGLHFGLRSWWQGPITVPPSGCWAEILHDGVANHQSCLQAVMAEWEVVLQRRRGSLRRRYMAVGDSDGTPILQTRHAMRDTCTSSAHLLQVAFCMGIVPIFAVKVLGLLKLTADSLD
ncbi:hypothetical protein BJ875DRAFT_110028 [Amylocarpus encephaloides]|uniref:Uncharacterized protein n=1 Tax=Amylocarpus encephaloides TaxID=45428 RepID=A0A9P7YEN4_9HELO|nr:hypothetical protein BJ875DRAFT_110028 [Amylocarpus encephaloides]